MKSRKGIFYDLSISEYRLPVNGITYVFSSQLHLNKFKERLKENRKAISQSLSNRFNIHIDLSTLADLVLYRKIETRGFLIVVKEDNVECLNDITYAGGRVTMNYFGGK